MIDLSWLEPDQFRRDIDVIWKTLGTVSAVAILPFARLAWKRDREWLAVKQVILGYDGNQGIRQQVEEIGAEVRAIPQKIVDSRHLLRGEITKEFLDLGIKVQGLEARIRRAEILVAIATKIDPDTVET